MRAWVAKVDGASTHKIDLSGYTGVTDAGVSALSDKCDGLKYIGLKGCTEVTEARVLALADKCGGL